MFKLMSLYLDTGLGDVFSIHYVGLQLLMLVTNVMAMWFFETMYAENYSEQS